MSITRDRIYAVCVMFILLLVVLVPITPAVTVYGRVGPDYTSVVVQQMAESPVLYHFWSTATILVLAVLLAGLYGLHLKTLNGTAGDAVQAVGLGFFALSILANSLENGMTHVILHTIHFSTDTNLDYDLAILFAHHLITVAYCLVAVSNFAGSIGLIFLALGFSGKGLHRFNRPVCLVVAAIGVGMAVNATISNVFPESSGVMHTVINGTAVVPMLWLCFMGVLFWRNSGRPWVAAPEEPPPPRLVEGSAAG